VDIADDGTFLFREAVRINFGHLVAQQFNGDIVNVSGMNKLLCYIRWWLHVQQAMAAPMSVANLPFPGPLPFVSTCSLDPGAVCSLPVVVAHIDHRAVTCSLELIARTHTLSLLLCSPLLLCCPLQVNVWRDGAHHSLQVHLSTPHQLVPNHSHDIKPTYFIYAGLVFTPLTTWYLKR
jgi:hypothetical protein